MPTPIVEQEACDYPRTNLKEVLHNIYQNLIDEDDIIIEEDSKEGISQNTLSEIQLL